jgi:hypothetical protein
VRSRWAVGVGLSTLLLAACSAGATSTTDEAAVPDSPSAAGETSPEPGGEAAAEDPGAETGPPRKPLRAGERIVDVAMPATYSPSPPGPGTDDYRCFLLDPGLASDAFVTGVDVVPGNPHVVHHVILFRVPPGQIGRAEALDATTPGEGWTCFGGSGLENLGGDLDDAPWLGAWAPGGGERLLGPGVGVPVEAGSRIVMQVHYNLLGGSEPDRSSARLRVTGAGHGVRPLATMLLPAPVELPCRAGVKGALCDRDTAVLDVMSRFGPRSGQTVAGLQLLCGAGKGIRPGPTQSCTRTVQEPATVWAVAGHMHLLGRKIRIEANPGTSRARTLLDIPVWDFDDQGTRPLQRPARLRPGDELTVTCTHDQGLRDLLPAFEGAPERYVVWGEGTTDEMCLGLALVTRP